MRWQSRLSETFRQSEFCPYEAMREGRQTDASYLASNPLERVPALVTASHVCGRIASGGEFQ
jgi:hypothetical protein